MFETLLVRDGHVDAAAEHLRRLRGSVGRLYGRELPPDVERRLHDHAATLTGAHRLRVDATPSAAKEGVDIEIRTSPIAGGPPTPVRLAPLTVPGGLGAHKWRDRRLLDAAPADPVALLVDADGTVLEAAWANVWMLDDGRLITPPADGRILPGVTRARLLALAPSLGLRAREEAIDLPAARAASVLFLTSSLRLAVAATLAGPPAPLPAETAVLAGIRAALAPA